MDIYICDKKNPKRVLAGLRCGEVMEAIVTIGQDDSNKEEEESKQGASMFQSKNVMTLAKPVQTQVNTFLFEWFTFLSSHGSLHVN